MSDANAIEKRLARARARDELNELIEERATALAEAEGSSALSRLLVDKPDRQAARDDYRARTRLELNMACCAQYGIGDHDPVEHGGSA